MIRTLYTDDGDYADLRADAALAEAERRAMAVYLPEARSAYVTDCLADAEWHRATLACKGMEPANVALSLAIASGDYGRISEAVVAYRNALKDHAKHEALIDAHNQVRDAARALWLAADE